MLSKLSQKSMLNAFSVTNMIALQAMQQNSALIDVSKASFFNVLKQSQQDYSRVRSASHDKSRQVMALNANRFFSSSSSSSSDSEMSAGE